MTGLDPLSPELRIMTRGMIVLFALGICSPLRADEPIDLQKVGLPTALLAPEAVVTVGARTCLLEGPAFDESGNLFFSDVYNSKIYRLSTSGKVTLFRGDSGRTNGNTFDALGRLVSCEGTEQGIDGRRRIVRTDMQTERVTVLTDRYQGKRYNSPNDLCVDTKGRIFFSDPYYGEAISMLELDHESVYRIDPNGDVTRVLTQPTIERPNGVAVTPDNKTLYVADSNGRPGGNRTIWSFDLSEEGTPGKRKLVFDFGTGRGADGIKLDERGNLWVAAGIAFPRNSGETNSVPPGVYVITPQGQMIGRIPIPEDLCTNLAFGGPDRKTLVVTAGKCVYKIPLAVSGYHLYPPVTK